eukprot:m.73804 g.73804  ORF g.73804 m.73804 type:complete len:82 (-) comp12435_c0_seq4:337-582(-)
MYSPGIKLKPPCIEREHYHHLQKKSQYKSLLLGATSPNKHPQYLAYRWYSSSANNLVLAWSGKVLLLSPSCKCSKSEMDTE